MSKAGIGALQSPWVFAVRAAFIGAAAFTFACWLRVGTLPEDRLALGLEVSAFALCAGISAFSLKKSLSHFALLDRAFWMEPAATAILTVLLFMPGTFLATRADLLPRSVIPVAAGLLAIGLVGPALTTRLGRELASLSTGTFLPRRAAAIAFTHDVIMAALAFVTSLYLRLNEALFEQPADFVALNTVIFVACAASAFRVMGLYRGVWRYASTNDLVAIAKSVTLASLLFVPATFLATRFELLPRSILIINWLVLVVFLGGPRFLYRLLKDGRTDVLRRDTSPRIPVLLIGAGDGAELFIRATQSDGAPYHVVGILDENPARSGSYIRGIPVLGVPEHLPRIASTGTWNGPRPQRIVITEDEFRGERVRGLFEVAQELGLSVSRLPRITQLRASDASEKIEIQPIAIEDLLNRPQTVLDRPAMTRLIERRRVLVTGAGGSIGSELVRQISDLGPECLWLLDNSEYHLYEIDRELAERHPELSRAPVLADVRDRGRIESVIRQFKPDLVFHAAALKHVPMVEAHPAEGVLTNVVGTRNVADACRTHAVNGMVLISTDKAVNPSSVMGATKRAAESYCQALDVLGGDKSGATRFATVRFGNVLGSTGSVVPLFQKQLSKGGPLTVTHPDIRRFFMTIREAVELVLQASALRMTGSESEGKLFVLDMGKPVRIQDLARQMIRLSGLRPDEDVRIKFTGLRQGEKLNEELFHHKEPLAESGLTGILLAFPRTGDHAILARAFDGLAEVARRGDDAESINRLQSLVPEFHRDEPQGAQQKSDTSVGVVS